MSEKFLIILNWSEVWALLIPLFVLLFHRKQPNFLRPVVLYLWLALLLNISGDIIADFKLYFPAWLQSNTVLYNVHSVIRFTCFSSFFILLRQPYYKGVKKMLPFIFILFITVNFSMGDNFFNPKHLSGNLLAAEAYLLLVYCMTYYLSELKEEKVLTRGKDFWVVTGLSIYVVTNFFVFLFYVPMMTDNPDLASSMWNIHNVVYILLCLLIAKSLKVVL